MDINKNEIAEFVRKSENDYVNGYIQSSKYVSESLYEDINKIEAYLNSKHTSGEFDTLNREKPFFNIVLAARNIWFRATDIDRKNIKIKPTKRQDVMSAFVATVYLQEFMKRDNFGQFLNNWGLELSSYCSSIVKFVEQDGKLHSMVMPWNRMIVDQIDFENNPKIEILELTPAQLIKRKGYDKTVVANLLSAVSAREGLDKQKKDTKDNYIKLYEVHGEFPLSYLTGRDEDSETYVQQMQVVSFVAKKGAGYDDFTLVKGREEKDPYMLTCLFPNVDGSISLNGSVKNLFQAQWMINHSVKAIKDQLDLSSKIIFQTSDPNFVGQNVLSAVEEGQILIHKKDEPLTHLANNANDITSLQSFGQQWQILSQSITSTPDITRGDNMPSETAYRQAAIVQGESQANFVMMTQNKGLALEQMMRKFIIPFLKKKMDTSKELATVLETNDITKIDSVYVPNEATKRFNSKVIKAILDTPEGENIDTSKFPNLDNEMSGVKNELSVLGNQRFFKPSDIPDRTWKEVFKDLEWDLEVEITPENTDKQAILETLSNIFNTIADPNKQQILQTPEGKLLFNKILSESYVVSPMELSSIPQPMNNQPVNPQVGKVVPGNNQLK